MRRLLVLLLSLMLAMPAAAQRFVAVSFHGVVDDEKDLGSDDITTGRLIAFFDWLRGTGWTPVTLDDIAAAGAGVRALPPKPILITFDDGYKNAYTRVYPLLLAYRYPAVLALVGSWMDAPMTATVSYGGEMVPRANFLSWENVREMQSSGLVEFASHSYALHTGIRGNPQGSMPPSAATWTYDPRTGTYESDASMQARVTADLRKAIALMRSHTGKAPRALVWPFGRYAGPSLTAAREAGFRFAITLDPEPADARHLMAIPRLFPARDPKLGTMAEELRFADPTPTTRRTVCLSLDGLARGDAAARDAALGTIIESIRRLGANTAVVDPAGAAAPGVPMGVPMGAVWFPTGLLPMQQDLLGFVAWQIRTRGGVDMFLRIDLRAATAAVGRDRVPALVRDMVRATPFDGVLLDPPGNLLSAGTTHPAAYPWSIRDARATVDPIMLDADGRLAWDAWQAAVALRPTLRLALTVPADVPGSWPAPAADWLLMQPPVDGLEKLARRLFARGWLAPDVGPRLVLPLPTTETRAAIRSMRAVQTIGATAFSLCPAPVLPSDPALNAAFSASSFPYLP